MRELLHAMVIFGLVAIQSTKAEDESPTTREKQAALADLPEHPFTGFKLFDTPIPSEPPRLGAGLKLAPRNTDTDSALFSAGEALQKDGRLPEALLVLQMVLAGKHEPPYEFSFARNTQHFACKLISEIYEARGELREALEFAVLARDRYPFCDACGLAVMGVREDLDERIASLNSMLQVSDTEE